MNHFIKFQLPIVLALFSTVSGQAAGNNWMAGVDGEKYLYELSIPGTHDSGALHEEWYEIGVQCQSLTIPEQLNAGVRYLDIRCRHLNNAFVIHHGAYYQYQNFNDVLESVTSFLRANPSETVVMSVKPEYDAEGNTRTFAETFKAYQTEWETRYPGLWHGGATVPKLIDVRGKIVLIRRFNETPFSAFGLGINADSGWPGDSTGTIEGPPRIRVQDAYKIYIKANKWGYITSLFNEMPANPSTLYLNHVSCAWYPPAAIPYSVKEPAAYYNYHLVWLFDGGSTPATSRRYGVVIVDFVNDNLAYLIYRTNFSPATTPVLGVTSGNIGIVSMEQNVNLPGVFKIIFAGEPGGNYQVQKTSDLVNWSDATSATANSNGYFQFIDFAATNNKSFYRSYQIPPASP
jgi:1-phosphatidylinositol phosphodiesterase